MRRIAWGAALVVVIGSQALAQQPQPRSNAPRVLRVDRYEDDGAAGSLRWAIETSNADPGRFTIQIAPPPAANDVIRLRRALPPIKGPVEITGLAWAQSGGRTVIDGSGYLAHDPKACPGAVTGYGANVRTVGNPGLALVDTHDVIIRGVEVRNFCIGILVHRTSRSVIEHDRFVNNAGGAGVMLTGDDGSGEPTNATFGNRIVGNEFVDNGDALELTRGAAFNLVAENTFVSGPANPEPSQGIEILRGDDNVLIGNRFSGYSDGVQINSGRRNYIAGNIFTDNTFGLSLSGEGNVVIDNTITRNGSGIVMRAENGARDNRISRNVIASNGLKISRCAAGGSCDPSERREGIVAGYRNASGNTAAQPCDPDACPPPTAPPRLTRATRDKGSVRIVGDVNAKPQTVVTIEFFGARAALKSEAESFIGQTTAVSDAGGHATFSATVRAPSATKAVIATAKPAGDSTSEFSNPIPLR